MESFDNEVLEQLNKKATAEDNFRAIKLTAEAGITVRCLMMIGLPGQTRVTIDRNITALSKLPHCSVPLKHFIPLPGSDIWHFPAKYGIKIVNTDLNLYNYYMYDPNGLRPSVKIIQPIDYDPVQFEEDGVRFINWLIDTGRMFEGKQG